MLETFVFQADIADEIGTDLSIGVEYRPLLNDNIIVTGGYAVLIPGRGFDDLFGITDPFTLLGAQQRDIDAADDERRVRGADADVLAVARTAAGRHDGPIASRQSATPTLQR